MRLFRRIKYRNYANDELVELNEMLTKFGRRVTHDLDHALSSWGADLGMLERCGESPNRFLYDRVRTKTEHWRDVFYPDHGPKNYRSEIYAALEKSEAEVARLVKLCKANGLDHEDPDGIPF